MKNIVAILLFSIFLLIPEISSSQSFVDKQFVGCGLDYEMFTSRLSLRADNSGTKFPRDTMPVKYELDLIQEDREIVNVFLFASISGSNIDFSPTLIDADSVSHSLSYLEVETGDDPCWSYAEKNFLTYDVTTYFNQNGNYYFDGFPLSSSLSGTDTDGILLMVIYADPFEPFIGNLYFSKGVIESNLSTATYIIKNLDIEETTTSAQGFLLLADLQDQGSKISINNSSLYGINEEEFWDLETKNTAVFAGQPTSSFKLSSPNDCAHMLMAGLYFQQSHATQSNSIVQVGDTLIASEAEGYEWLLNDSLISDAADSIYVATYPGTYAVVTEDLGGCKYESSTIEMTCFQNFVPQLDQDGRLLHVDSFYVSYQWFQDGIEISGSIGDSLYTNDSASYYVEVVDTLGCSYVSNTILYSSPNTINDVDKLNFAVYPNPSDGKFVILLPEEGSVVTLEVYSLEGKQIYTNYQISNIVRINLEAESGIYFIKATNQEGLTHIQKILVK